MTDPLWPPILQQMEGDGAVGAFGSAEPLLLLLAALAVEGYIGEMRFLFRRVPHPRVLVTRAVRDLERRLNRPRRSARNRLVRGAMVGGVVVGSAALAGLVISLFARNFPFGWLLEVLLLAALVEQRSTWRYAAAVGTALRSGSATQARAALAQLAGERLRPGMADRLSSEDLTKAALAAIGIRFADAVFAPVFWYVLLGLPGILVQNAARVMAAALGDAMWVVKTRTAGTGEFGCTAVLLDRCLAFLPFHLAGVLLAGAATFVHGIGPLTVMRRLSESRCWPAAAMTATIAFDVGIRLDASVAVSRACVLFAVACLLNAGLIGLLALIRLAVS